MELSLQEKLTIVSALTRYVLIEKKESGKWFRAHINLLVSDKHSLDLLTSHVVFEYHKMRKGL